MESGEIERRSSMFDEYAHEEGGVEFWYARDLMRSGGTSRLQSGAPWLPWTRLKPLFRTILPRCAKWFGSGLGRSAR